MTSETLEVVFFKVLNGCRVLISYAPRASVPYTLRIDGQVVGECLSKQEAIDLAYAKSRVTACTEL